MLKSRTPGLLKRMTERRVGELIVMRDRIIEPRTERRVAHGFPNEGAAVKAAEEMNEVADWFGIIKARAEGMKPNCQEELRAIAERYGGKLSDGASGAGLEELCAKVVAAVERS